jgi:GTPase Era involved in 16S rRNA processing
VFAQDIRNPDLLRHEIYHFHIAEYCSRLIRKEIFENRNSITPGMIKELDNSCRRTEQEMQDKYDDDSYHSYVLQQQKKWEAQVDSMLYSLQAYSDPVIHIINKE